MTKIVVFALLGLLIFYQAGKVLVKTLRGMMQNRAIANSEANQAVADEQQNIVFKKLWLDVEPAPLKVIVFAEGKTECRLVMHGPYEGVVKRLLMMWKGDKHRSIQLEALCAVEIESIEQVYKTSLEEATKLAIAVFGKKKHAKSASAATQVAPQPRAVASPVPVVAERQVMVPAVPVPSAAPSAPHVREIPTIKGFIAQYVGKITFAGLHKHPTGNYDSFTLQLDTTDGPVTLYGVDLKRAMTVANVEEGDKVRAIFVKKEDLPGGKVRNQYQIVKLDNSSA